MELLIAVKGCITIQELVISCTMQSFRQEQLGAPRPRIRRAPPPQLGQIRGAPPPQLGQIRGAPLLQLDLSKMVDLIGSYPVMLVA